MPEMILVDSHIQQEIINIKARLYELQLFQNEKDILREKLAYLIGKNEGIQEMEKLMDKKIDEAIKKVGDCQCHQ
jgi:hypothetical protein